MFALGIGWFSYAQTTSLSQTLRLWAVASENPNSIILKWPKDSRTGVYTLFRKLRTTATWTSLAQLPDTANLYTDSTAQPGIVYDYRLQKGQIATGYAAAAIAYRPADIAGSVLLIVEKNMAQKAAEALARYRDALWAEGWKVSVLETTADASVESLKAQIVQIDSALQDLEAIVLLGRVPVPYSGDWLYDGHSDHRGAWPADVYYSVISKGWTDKTVNNTSAARTQNHNVPGDGKFDQTYLPGKSKFQIGRVDFEGIRVGVASPDELLVSYIERNLAFRQGKTRFRARGLVDDNFGSLNLAATGWANFSNFFGADSVWAEDYFTTLRNTSYLFSYGAGAGSYTSCSGVGSSSDFVATPPKHAFTLLAGSYFGDWDTPNNLMRTAIATSALACGWGGIPRWHLQHAALGFTIGYGTRLTQNNTTEFFNGNFNGSANAVHIALMGDPTLRLFPISPPQNLTYEDMGNQMVLRWQAVAGASYHVYRIDSAQKSIQRLTEQPITDNFFTVNKFSGKQIYSVRAVVWQKTGGGTFLNQSAGALLTTDFATGMEEKPQARVYPNPSQGNFRILASISPVAVRLLDIAGRIVETDFQDGELQVPSAPSGLYILEIVWPSGEISSQKVVINR